jgi:Complex 1 protein (LYR family)
MSKSVKAALNLKQFMLRQEVLKLFRELYRTISKVPDETSRKELRLWLREDFRKNKDQTEEITIKMAMQVGQRSLKELQNSLELSGIYCGDKKTKC